MEEEHAEENIKKLQDHLEEITLNFPEVFKKIEPRKLPIEPERTTPLLNFAENMEDYVRNLRLCRYEICFIKFHAMLYERMRKSNHRTNVQLTVCTILLGLIGFFNQNGCSDNHHVSSVQRHGDFYGYQIFEKLCAESILHQIESRFFEYRHSNKYSETYQKKQTKKKS